MTLNKETLVIWLENFRYDNKELHDKDLSIEINTTIYCVLNYSSSIFDNRGQIFPTCPDSTRLLSTSITQTYNVEFDTRNNSAHSSKNFTK